MTKQAASQLVAALVERGYVQRLPDPADGRARQLRLTELGWVCTRAAEEAAGDVAAEWQHRLGDHRLATFGRILATLAQPGRLRPAWQQHAGPRRWRIRI